MKMVLFFLISIILPVGVLSAAANGNLTIFLNSSDPLVLIAIVASTEVFICFAMGWLTGEYSWVDRIWSIAPVVYAWIIALRAWPDMRTAIAAILITFWGLRLTFNFARKGGYTGVEDYRWAEMRKTISNPILWQLFNLGFISFYQNLLLVLIVMPLYAAYLHKGRAFGMVDLAAAVLFLIFLILETVADQQQWNFQQEKKAASGDPVVSKEASAGFIDYGLFRYSRHPNYFSEISMWWMVYLFGVSASLLWLNWSLAGPVLLTVLFIGSTQLTEKISGRKYPLYQLYQKRTSPVIPWFPRMNDKSDS